jgi:hypothetical protein
VAQREVHIKFLLGKLHHDLNILQLMARAAIQSLGGGSELSRGGIELSPAKIAGQIFQSGAVLDYNSHGQCLP